MKGFTGVADKQGGWGDCACVTGRGTGFAKGRVAVLVYRQKSRGVEGTVLV